MFINLFNLNNLDLLIVGIVVAATCVLGFVVYFSNKKSVSNKEFLIFSIATAMWGVVNYFSYQFTDPNILLLLFRLILFFAVFQAFSLYRFLTVFPEENYFFSFRHKYILIPVVICTAILTLSPYVFSGVTGTPVVGEVAGVEKGPGLVLFALVAVGLVVKAFLVLIKKIRSSKNVTERKTLDLIMAGLITMFLLIISFNLVLATVFSSPGFIPLGAVFVFPFIVLTSYAILKRKVFNIKIANTAILVFFLTTLLFLEVIFSTSFTLIIFRSSIFILILIVGIGLIRSVIKEVEQKEELYKLNIDLAYSIQQRESLVHLVTHKVKGSFTRTKYIFAGLLDGTFGEINEEVRKYAMQGLESDNMGIETVDLVLNAANMEKGLIKYNMQNIDLKELVLKSIDDKRMSAENKGLKIINNVIEDTFVVSGDAFWLKEVFNNLIENSIKYTKEGTISIGLEKKDNKILFFVKDTGVGLNDEDRKILFTEGGRGKDSIKVNVDSTGYGLYTVKLVVNEHKGKVWAESEGPGKGSQFYVELDAIK